MTEKEHTHAEQLEYPEEYQKGMRELEGTLGILQKLQDKIKAYMTS